MLEQITRKQFLGLVGLTASAIVVSSAALADDNQITREMVFNDPDSPTGGNPNGDVTIVDFFDYNCPYCKDSEQALDIVLKKDGNIRVAYKDWPILSKTSVIGARLALGAKYQGQYLAAHNALMQLPGYDVPQDFMIDAVKNAGVDMTRLDADISKHSDDILKLLKKNQVVAQAVGFQGLPATLVGVFKVNAALDEKGFEQVIADARARQKAAR